MIFFQPAIDLPRPADVGAGVTEKTFATIASPGRKGPRRKRYIWRIAPDGVMDYSNTLKARGEWVGRAQGRGPR